MASNRELRILGRTLAEIQGRSTNKPRPPATSARLAAIYQLRARRERVRRRWSRFGYGAGAAALAAALMLFVLRPRALEFRINEGAGSGVLGVLIAAPHAGRPQFELLRWQPSSTARGRSGTRRQQQRARRASGARARPDARRCRAAPEQRLVAVWRAVRDSRHGHQLRYQLGSSAPATVREHARRARARLGRVPTGAARAERRPIGHVFLCPRACHRLNARTGQRLDPRTASDGGSTRFGDGRAGRECARAAVAAQRRRRIVGRTGGASAWLARAERTR